MADPNLRDFYGRVYRIRKAHRRGGGFEAAGALGRAYFLPRPVRGVWLARILRPLIFLAIAVTVLKAVILSDIGIDTYGNRLAQLQQGSSLDRIGAVIMTADPVTSYLAAKFAAFGA